MTDIVQSRSSLSEMNTAFERLQDSVSKEDARSFSITALKDVWEAAKDVERNLEK